MKRVLISTTLMLLLTSYVHGQLSDTTFTENFDGSTVSFTPTPSTGWTKNTAYALSSPNSYRARVPTFTGDTVIVETGVYDLQLYNHAQLRFSHICKVSPNDITKIQYKITGMGWQTLEKGTYLGNGLNYDTSKAFNAASYPQWRADDSTVLPQQPSWWKDEVFDVSFEVGNDPSVQFRFILIHGPVSGTEVSYGWLLDNFELSAANYKISAPIVQFTPPLVKDSVYNTGPWAIHAKVKTTTSARIEQPRLKYTATHNSTLVRADSILMDHISGDSLWKAVIPQFLLGTEVRYSITGKDTTGNDATVNSGYIIKQPAGNVSGFQYVGDTNSTNTHEYIPYTPYYEYGWSRSLVLSSEIDQNRQGGLISSVGYFPTYYGRTSTMNNQTLYFKVVQDVDISSDAYIDPVTDGATLVWQGSIAAPPTNQWMDILLTTPFMLPPNSNLLVYWNNNDGTYVDDAEWKSTSFSPVNMSAYNYDDGSFPSYNGTLTSDRVNMRFNVLGGASLDYSAAMLSIDIPDTITVSPGIQVPIVVTVKNKGKRDLDSAVVSYSINGSPLVYTTRYFNPALPWDFNRQDTIGYYSPQAGHSDIVSVKIELPNGKYDSTTRDDELVKTIYGKGDIQMRFVNPIHDTTYTTGPFTISVMITSSSPIPAGNVLLYVETIQPGGTQYDTLPMVPDVSTNLWKAAIPRTPYGSDVFYSVTLTDVLGNTVTIADSFHVKRWNGPSGYVIIGNQSSNTYGNPYHEYYRYGWSRNLYLASEISPTSSGQIITTLAWSVQSPATITRNPQSCFLKAVPDDSISNVAWENPLTSGATLVWRGSLHAVTGWNEITLLQPFVLHPGQNLLVYWIDSTGAYAPSSNGLVFHSTPTSSYMSIYEYDDNSFPNINGLLSDNRPDIRFNTMGSNPDSNAVALASITSPSSGVTAGTPVDVEVVIENTGIKDLDSCRIHWTLNGTPQLPLPYYLYNNAPVRETFTDTVTIGSYTPVPGQIDEIVVWVSMPNGVTDTNRRDDTLRMFSIGCSGIPYSGNILIGNSSSAQFSTISEAIFGIASCGMSGKVALEVESGNYPESVDFTLLNNLLTNNDTIELRSLSGNPSDVIIENSVLGIILGNSNNITIKNLTVNILGEGRGIYFTDSCTNIEINGCIINLDTTLAKNLSGGSTHVGICKLDNSKAAHHVRIVNNIITGGYNGVILYGGPDTNNLGTNWIYDSNTVINAYLNSVFLNSTAFLRISYNTSIPMNSNAYSSIAWTGFVVQYGNMDIFANNRVHALRNSNLEDPNAVWFAYINEKTAPAKIYNNEILISKAGSNASDVFTFNSSSADIYHNSIYVGGTAQATCYGLYINTSYPTAIKNNNIVTTKYRPVYIDDASITSDYNNFYTEGTTFGNYMGTVVNNFAAWQTTSGKDIHSVNVFPSFMDINTGMDIYNPVPVACPLIPDVPRDINGKTRDATTIMGAYAQIRFPDPEAVIDIHNWNPEDIANQTKPVEVTITNLSSQPLQTVVLEWTLNGNNPVSYTWNTPSALPFLGQAVITIGSFPVSDTNEVEIWIASINGNTTFLQADTIYAYSEVKPLAEFVAPFIKNTTYALSFDIYTVIRPYTGAPTVAPRMNLKTIVNGSVSLYDTIDMILEDDAWVTHVPQQYYGSNVIYSVMISDTIGNTIMPMDSTYIKFTAFGKNDTVAIGTGTSTSDYNPYYYNYDYSWSRNYYRSHEIDPGRIGGYINSIAFYNTSTSNSDIDNVSFYLKAVSDSIVYRNTYVDPLTDGATLVWGPATSSTNGMVGWITYTLDTLFYLPPNMNLLVYCNNEDGSWAANGEVIWRSTTQAINTSIYAYDDDIFPPSDNLTVSENRPDLQLSMSSQSTPYTGNDLAILSMVSPVNIPDKICNGDYAPVRINLTNLGENDYDFTQDPIDLTLEVRDPALNLHTEYVHIDTGGLESGESITVELMPVLSIINPGQYHIKAWVSSNIDQVIYDDTLLHLFSVNKVSLPVDENFSNGISHQIFTTKSNSIYGWETIPQGTGADTAVKPVFGNGMLSFSGSRGAKASLATHQLQLTGTSLPTLEFWYFHDTLDSDDYTTVRITSNGSQYTPLLSILKTDIVYGWKRYEVDLSPYTNGQCISVLFESMVMSANVTQYIDRIRISSLQDVAVAGIVTSEINACDLQNKTWKVIVANGTAQEIDFATQPTAIQLDIVDNISNPSFTYPLVSGKLKSNSSDTFEVAANFNFTKGTYMATAYLTVPIDDNPGNDTGRRTINIDPSLSVKINPISGGSTNCLNAGLEINQTVLIINTGNMELLNTNVILSINASDAIPPYTHSIKENTGAILPGDTVEYTFKNSYTVPWAPSYQLQSVVYLICDSAMVNSTTAIDECADINNLALVSIDKPSGQVDSIGTNINIEVTLENKSDATPFSNVVIHARIEDSKGTITDEITETISKTINPLYPESHIFATPYTVPDDSVYYITAFIDKQDKDNYQQDDTIQTKRITDYKVGIESIDPSKISMEQNIPNPAKNSTIIKYCIPESGEVIFHIHSMNGQLFYNKVVQSEPGVNSIEVNTSTLSAGIYMYSMEYKGQRIVKRMSIKR